MEFKAKSTESWQEDRTVISMYQHGVESHKSKMLVGDVSKPLRNWSIQH